MSPSLKGSTALKCFERSNAVEIRNRIMFDFYPGLPHMYANLSQCKIMTEVNSHGLPISLANRCVVFIVQFSEVHANWKKASYILI